MGRRAKNKQGAPAPLRDPSDTKRTQKKLGKRKADVDAELPVKRPAKKAKNAAATMETEKQVKVPRKVSAVKEVVVKGKGKGKQTVSKIEEVIEDTVDSEGWEDVEDEVDLQVQKRCVCYMLL
jgi:ribosomal RNA methyltransferase Nop2